MASSTTRITTAIHALDFFFPRDATIGAEMIGAAGFPGVLTVACA